MADRQARKRKAEKADDFFHIRAKGQFLKVPKGQEYDDRDVPTAKGKKKKKLLSRRDQRRQARVQKKARKIAFFSNKKDQVSKVPNSASTQQNINNSASSKKLPNGNLVTTGTKKRKKKKKAKEAPESQDVYRQKLVEDNKKEDKEIKKLEKLLRLDKKKKVPSQFSTEGLDSDLLEVCDPLMMTGKYDANQRKIEQHGMDEQKCSRDEQRDFFNDSDDASDASDASDIDEEERDLNEGTSYKENDNEEYNDNSDDGKDNDDDEDDGDVGSGDDDDGDSGKDDNGYSGDGDNGDSGDDNDDGDNQVQESNENINMQKYVPPHLRKQESSEEQREHLHRIKRQMKGLLNRLSEGNMSVISSEIENLFIHNSRNDMNRILSDLILGSCVSVSLMPDKLLMEHVMLLAILTSHIGIEVGAFFVERLAEAFDRLHNSKKDSYGQGKECVNVVALFAHLYNFKIIHCCLVYDIIRRLADTFSGQDIELLLLLLKNTGAEIRRDDPASLKDIIRQIQAKAAAAPNLTSDSRVRFMLEIISNLRNNNLRKIPGYDSSRIEHLRKVLRSVTRESNQASSSQLKISLEDLLKSDTKGRWWIAGSSLSRGGESDFKATSAQMENSKLLELARKQRMNTDVRKNVFLVMMTSEDYVDAFEKLLRLNLKDVQTREVIHVLIDCCMQEKTYNPYYAYLGQKFCEYSRSYQVTFQYSLWDKFKVVSDLAPHSVNNLSRLLSHLFATRAVSLAILKVVNFMELDKPSVRLFTHLFQHVLLDYSTQMIRNMFERISSARELASLRQSLRIFIKHFVRKAKFAKTGKDTDLEGRLKLVDEILGASDIIKL